ncbi:hypothetical protein PIB30_094589, partial [Stylosanthes scabra]|nr:hypothetical protein [Stylosanthes scabra]
KGREELDLNQAEEMMEAFGEEIIPPTKPSLSYKEFLLSSPGMLEVNTEVPITNVEENDPNPEDRWYNEESTNNENPKALDPCPVIPVSKEQFNEWYKPWHDALIVKVLGERVGLAYME